MPKFFEMLNNEEVRKEITAYKAKEAISDEIDTDGEDAESGADDESEG